jgi:hypothetical protein
MEAMMVELLIGGVEGEAEVEGGCVDKSCRVCPNNTELEAARVLWTGKVGGISRRCENGKCLMKDITDGRLMVSCLRGNRSKYYFTHALSGRESH